MGLLETSKNLSIAVKSKLRTKISFEDLEKLETVCLYAGDVPQNDLYSKFIGLSLSQSNFQHIQHDVVNKLPLQNNSIDMYQSEDVFEHIELENLPPIIDEIYRVLKPGGVFRLSLPDYRCDILYERSRKDEDGSLQFDPEGGGDLLNGKVINGGHVWFPTYEIVNELLSATSFQQISFFHFYDESGKAITNDIDYSIGYIMRTPDHDERVQNPFRPMSIVVDCIK